MKKNSMLKPLALISTLIGLTCLAMIQADRAGSSTTPAPIVNADSNGPVALHATLTRDKVLKGQDGTIGLALDLFAAQNASPQPQDRHHVDLVIVLDQSGSMEGHKIDYAKRAILELLPALTPQDRFALVAYADQVQTCIDLSPAREDNLAAWSNIVRQMATGGGTNLGAGLQSGIRLLTHAQNTGRVGKLVLISDGLANQGVTDPEALGSMASAAAEKAFAISTVGVGDDFNEQLMNAIADRGTGTYHYLESPRSFARVFEQEFLQTRATVATSVKIGIPLENGLQLAEASGYPVFFEGNQAIFYPGDLLSGQRRRLFITLRVPTRKTGVYTLDGIRVEYVHQDQTHTLRLAGSFEFACIDDPQAVKTSYDKDTWAQSVVQDEYNRLKEEVALDIKGGKRTEAMAKIDAYQAKQTELNQVVGSDEVAVNLSRDVPALRQEVTETFVGNAGEVAQKRKQKAKALQYQGYVGRKKQ